MRERKWEELEIDCLLNVLKRVGMESLLLDVPSVCKSWYKASLDPSCWERLDFPKDQSFYRFRGRFMNVYRMRSLPVTGFIKLIIHRSQRRATLLSLPEDCCGEEVLKYAADECPALITLALYSDLLYEQSRIIQEVIGKWKDLKQLILGSSYNMTEIIAEVGVNCKNFDGLLVRQARIGEDEAKAIVTNIPKVKYLLLKQAYLLRQNLITILRGCKELVLLDVRDCIGFEADEKIMELASHIKEFKAEGSKVEEEWEEEWEADYYDRDYQIYGDYYSD